LIDCDAHSQSSIREGTEGSIVNLHDGFWNFDEVRTIISAGNNFGI